MSIGTQVLFLSPVTPMLYFCMFCTSVSNQSCDKSIKLTKLINELFPQSEKSALMEIMRVDLEEKIRKLEEDRHNSDISAGTKCSSQFLNFASMTMQGEVQKIFYQVYF